MIPTVGTGNLLSIVANSMTGAIQAPFAIYGDYNAVNIVGDSDTKKAVEAFEHRLSKNETNIDLTRNELNLLTMALKDLDERTAGMVKLPDGRTRYVNIVGGNTHVLMHEFHLTLTNSINGDMSLTLEHGQKAIELFEGAKRVDKESGVLGVYVRDGVGAALYILSSLACQKLSEGNGEQKYKELAYHYATNAVALTNSSLTLQTLAGSLWNLGRFEEATNKLQQALEIERNDSERQRIKKDLEKPPPFPLVNPNK